LCLPGNLPGNAELQWFYVNYRFLKLGRYLLALTMTMVDVQMEMNGANIVFKVPLSL
jgi:hypothetical protein